VILDGQVLVASIYGARLRRLTEENASIYGVALDGVIALHKDDGVVQPAASGGGYEFIADAPPRWQMPPLFRFTSNHRRSVKRRLSFLSPPACCSRCRLLSTCIRR
jgi:hypothetical protein